MPPAAPLTPKAGLFAPKDEKAFVKGVTAFIQGDRQTALAHIMEAMNPDSTEKHIVEEYFAAFCLVGLNRDEEAIPLLEQVIESSVEMPDWLMQKYNLAGHAEVGITASVVAELPNSNLTAALMLAEIFQEGGDLKKAVELLESLGSVLPDPVFALSLADLYLHLEQPDEVLRVTEGFTVNEDDVTCQLLVLKAISLHRKGLNDAALQVLKETLKSRKRSAPILRDARYTRGLVYESAGKSTRARQEWERINAEDPDFGDVPDRLGLAKLPPRPGVS